MATATSSAIRVGTAGLSNSQASRTMPAMNTSTRSAARIFFNHWFTWCSDERVVRPAASCAAPGVRTWRRAPACDVVHLVARPPGHQRELLCGAQGLHLLIDGVAANYLPTPQPLGDWRGDVIEGDHGGKQQEKGAQDGDHDRYPMRATVLAATAVKLSTTALARPAACGQRSTSRASSIDSSPIS